jgi:uncharacterized membrane-anchored protein YjiN (DUF445 family)
VTATAPAFADDDIGKRQQLVVMRRRATGLLVVITIVFVVARLAEDDGGTWVGYLRATAEAAMVGGLADWFAVTAMFRHPLGIPIPHTAIIPTRKDQIGRSLGRFLQANFLTGTVVSERLVASRPSARLAEWVARPGNAATVARHAADAITASLDAMGEDEVRGAIEDLVVSRLRATPLAPIAGRVLEGVTEGGRHHELLESMLKGLDTVLVEQKEQFRGRFGKESPWWVPESIDDRIFEKLYSGLRGFLAEVVNDPAHELRGELDTRLAKLADDLQHEPEMQARGEQLEDELLTDPAIRSWTASMWADVRRSLHEQAADPASPLRTRLERGVLALGERLGSDAALQARFDGGVARLASYVLDEYAGTLDDMITTTVERWDPVVVTSQLEVLLGRDLQFIRINGTLVGGLIGLGLHAVSEAIG